MLRTWLAILMVMAVLCSCAGADGSFSGANYDGGLAVVNGEVYCAGGNIGLKAIPIWRVGAQRLEKVRSRIGGWDNIYALDNELLTIEPVLNLGEMLGSIPTTTFRVRRMDVNTGKRQHVETFMWNTDDGVCNVFAAQNRIYRDVCAGKQHTLECRVDGEWVAVTAWTGDRAWIYDTFCMIGDRNAEKPEYVALYEFATGKSYPVTEYFTQGRLRTVVNGVLEDGVLYCMEDGGFTALELSSGREEMLLAWPDEVTAFILTDTQLLLMSHESEQVHVLERNGWELSCTLEMHVYPQAAVLNNGKLYIRCVYGDAGLEVIDLAGGESKQYSLE